MTNRHLKFFIAGSLALLLYINPILVIAAARYNAAPKDRPSATKTKAIAVKKSAANVARAGKTKTAGRTESRNLRRKQISEKQTPALLPGQTATLLSDGNWLLIGGEQGDGVLAQAVIKNWQTGATSQVDGQIIGRAWHTATVLPNGTVLVLGGVGADNQIIGEAKVYDPTTGKFSSFATKGITPRRDHSATVLTNGDVLIAGGVSQTGTPLSTLELLQSDSKIASQLTARLDTARRKHSATLLADGRVLLWSGTDEAGAELNSGEIYNPATRDCTWSGIAAEQSEPETLYVAGTLPENGAGEIAVNTRLAVRFSQLLDVKTLNSETVQLIGANGNVLVRIVPAENGKLLFLTPLVALEPGTTYNITVSAVQNTNGETLPSTAISFTTKSDEKKDEKKAEHDEPRRRDILPARPQSNDQEWYPDTSNLRGDWRSRRGKSEWQDTPPLAAAAGVTALAGKVLLLSGQPLAEVTVQIGDRTAQTDRTGRFLLTEISAGHHVMRLDGRTANRGGRTFGFFKIGVDVEAGKTNVLPFTSWMPQLDTRNVTTFSSPTASEIAITTPHIPGLEVRIPASATVRDADGNTVNQLSITPIPVDRTPFPLPANVIVPVFFTVQPGASRVIPPRARVIYPNYTNELPGTRIDFWNYDPEERGWYVYGKGTVTADGRQVVPDAGVVIYEFTGFMISRGQPAPPGEGPPPGADAKDGDPVDLATGLFVYDKTDLIVPDTMPIALARTYRPQDPVSRAFGIGTPLVYNMYLYSASAREFVEVDLILPDGGRVRYNRISPGTGFTDAVLEHTGSASAFYKSTLRWSDGQWQLALKNGTIFIFGLEAPLNTVKDRHGNKITISRARLNGYGSANGPITKLTSTNGRWIEFAYDGSERIVEARDNMGRTVSYAYDANGRLWKAADAQGGVTEYTYDSANRMLSIKDPRGIVYLVNEYDTAGRVKKQTQADGSTFGFAYTTDAATGKVTQTEVTDERGFVRRITFNTSGQTLTDTYAVGQPEEQKYTYERQTDTNLPLNVTDPLGRKTAFVYDATGNVTSVTNLAETPEAVTTNFTYEPKYHNLTSVTDPLSHTASFAYDALGNLISATDALNRQTTFAYDAAGRVQSATDALNQTIGFIYEGANLTRVTDPLNRSVSRSYDAAGRVVQSVGPLGHPTTVEYNNVNQPVRVANPRGGVILSSFDSNGNVSSFTDPKGGMTSYTYDTMDRVKTAKDPLQSATGSTSTVDYDLAGNIIKAIDRRGKATIYKYDALGRNTFVGFGTTGTTAVPTYESTISYTYDKANRLTSMVDSSSGTISYVYDKLDRITKETTPQGEVSYTYDKAGRQTSMTVKGQAAVNYTYDNANRLLSISKGTETVGFGYDTINRRTSLTLPNGVTENYTYDAASQLTGIIYKKGTTTLGNLTYGYDQAGRRTSVGGTYARSVLPATFNQQLTYNAANRLTGRGTAVFTYDANGNLTSDGTTSYTWNARNQLVSMSRTGLTASFAYDALGRRFSKTVNGTTTKYVYNGADAVQEQDGAGAATANMLVGGVDEVFSRTTSGGARMLLHDGLGSTIAALDSAGATQTAYAYEPFGATTQTGGGSNTSKYTGREDDGTGLYYYRARYYSPTLQRFISEDPIAFDGGDMNLYAYVANNPVNYNDASGLHKQDRWYGFDRNTDFVDWFHDNVDDYKTPNQPQATKEQLMQAFKEFEASGSPMSEKNKQLKRGRGSRGGGGKFASAIGVLSLLGGLLNDADNTSTAHRKGLSYMEYMNDRACRQGYMWIQGLAVPLDKLQIQCMY